MSKTGVIRFRCEAELKARFEAIAKLERRVPADLARLILEDYVVQKEAVPLQLNEKPVTYRTQKKLQNNSGGGKTSA
jgi:antitoxin component of RelBE/YafQ-DinJ toxin-antitoxin module